LALTEDGNEEELWGVGRGEGTGVCCKVDKGTKFTSSAVLLMSLGGPMTSPRTFVDFDRLWAAVRFWASFSFKHLKSAKSAVDCIAGVVEALRACRTYPGEIGWLPEGYVADLGVVAECIGTLYVSLQRSPSLGEASAFGMVGGTGVRYLSCGLRVKPSELPVLH